MKTKIFFMFLLSVLTLSFVSPQSRDSKRTSLDVIFTYNSYSEIIGNSSLEFNNIKKEFLKGEPISFCFSYAPEKREDNAKFIIQILDVESNKPVVKEEYSEDIYNEGKNSAVIGFLLGYSGKALPVGKYVVTVDFEESKILSEEFEVKKSNKK